MERREGRGVGREPGIRKSQPTNNRGSKAKGRRKRPRKEWGMQVKREALQAGGAFRRPWRKKGNGGGSNKKHQAAEGGQARNIQGWRKVIQERWAK